MIFKLPHVSVYKRHWVRRVVIVLTFPIEVARSTRDLYRLAKIWWNWDGIEPIGPPKA